MPSKADTVTKSGRVVKHTPKMEAFLEQVQKGDAAKNRKELVEKANELTLLLSQESTKKQDIQDKYQALLDERDLLTKLEETEIMNLDNEDKDIYYEFYDQDNTAIQASTEAAKQFLLQEDVKPEDSVSQAGSRTSKSSKTPSQIAALIEEKTRLAEIEIERKKILQDAVLAEERRKLEALKEEMDKREKLQKLERDMELSQAKIDILSQVGSSVNSHSSKTRKRDRSPTLDDRDSKRKFSNEKVPTSSPQQGYIPPKFDYTKRSRDLPDYIPTGPNPLESAFNSLAAAIDRTSRQTAQIEPPVFSGDVLQYSLWKRNFEELVERDVKEERRFIYLLKYTSGEARECIENLTHIDDIDAYVEGFKLLDERYGDKFTSYEAIKDKLENWPFIKDGEGLQLRKFADFLGTCLAAMTKNPSLKILDTMPENHKLLRKLPRRMVEKWSGKVDEWQYGSKGTSSAHEYPPFFVFVEFVKKLARIELGPVKRMMHKADMYRKSVRAHLTDVDENEEVKCFNTLTTQQEETCLYCSSHHRLMECTPFAKIPVKERIQFSYNKQLCRGCLQTGHFAWACKELQRCTQCQGRHHVLFHDESFKPRHKQHTAVGTGEGSKEPKTVLSTKIDDDNVTAHVVMMYVHNVDAMGQKRSKKVYGVIDTQSNACFISKSIASAIGAEGRKTQVELHTMAGTEDVQMYKVEGLMIEDKRKKTQIELPPTFIQNGMDINHDQIPRKEDVKKWPHLQKIIDELEEVDEKIEVGILLGRNCFRATKTTDFIPSEGNEPYGICTELGWGIVGNLEKQENKSKKTVWTHKTEVKETSPAKFFERYTVDFTDQHQEGKLSQDDMYFIKCLDEGLTITPEGNLMLPLPLKRRNEIPDNSRQAKASLNGLKKKFSRDEGYKKKFVEKMNALFDKGYAEVAPKEYKEGRSWHLTFHGVFHPKKVEELRVVFNGRREFLGFILNEILLQGPDQINSLIGVFCRFRKEKITLTCDIEAMFYQVLVTPADRDYLRFFWWPNGDTSLEPEEYRMRVHIFGATSSPGVANYALNKVAEMHEEQHGKETATFIKEGFYVDDGVTSKKDTETTIQLMHSSRALCAEGNFNLTKFSSNSKDVVSQIPENCRAKNLKEVDLTRDRLPQGYTLGIFICNEEDCIRFQVLLKAMPRTRRGILSTVSQVYDPLGLASPILLEGKRLLQKLCKDGLNWDAPIPEELLATWDEWVAQLQDLESMKFPRCYSPRGVEESVTRELHHFADASLSGFGQCSYLRLTYEDGEVTTCLVMAKAKVLPKQSVTVPRLELAAAVLAVRTARFLQTQLKIQDVKHHYWSDSRVVLGYINNDSKRFHVYVANRVANIREFTTPIQWHHVETHLNPADLASRGTTVEELKNSVLWQSGPDFLRTSVEEWPACTGEMVDSDPEIRKLQAYKTIVKEETVDWLQKFQKFSTWQSLTRAMTVIRNAVTNATTNNAVEDRKLGELLVIRKTQLAYFSEEIHALQQMKEAIHKEIPRIMETGRLRKLDAFIDDDGILRVGGRFKHGPWSFQLKHPIILPAECHVSTLLIRFVHHRVAHSGREATLSALRCIGYWVLAGRRRIDSIIWQCVVCRRFRGQANKQKMGNLPAERLDEVPAFTHVGVDFFGPYSVKMGRGVAKRYIVIYTCLVTRATHLDKAYGLSSDEFLNSYRRFTSRRGAVATLRSDRGTNFVGARDDLERNLDDLMDDKIKQALIDSNCQFVKMTMNPPSASHMGGVWERPIGTGKRIISKLLHEYASMLTDDLLDTVVCETEGIMNGMPLTSIDTSGADFVKPLTPNMLLTMKPSVAPPPLHKFDRTDVCAKRRWRRAQHVVGEFWKRWRNELIPKWQERKKWQKTVRNMVVGDVVLLTNEDVPRMSWPLGIVTKVMTGDDGLVRSVMVKTKSSEYTRPVHKLLVLVEKSPNPTDETDGDDGDTESNPV